MQLPGLARQKDPNSQALKSKKHHKQSPEDLTDLETEFERQLLEQRHMERLAVRIGKFLPPLPESHKKLSGQ